MILMQSLSVTYANWKNMRTFLAGTVNSYYIQTDLKYTLVVVDLSRKVVTTSHLHRKESSDHANVVDFETNIKPTSISQLTIDDCVAAAIIG